jgi:hypothetical protein
VAPALPLSKLGVVEVGAPPVGQDEIVAERGGTMEKPGHITVGSAQGLNHGFADLSYPSSRLLVGGLDLDRSLLARQEGGDEVTQDLEYPATLPCNEGLQSLPLLLREVRIEVQPAGAVPSQKPARPVRDQGDPGAADVDAVDFAAVAPQYGGMMPPTIAWRELPRTP